MSSSSRIDDGFLFLTPQEAARAENDRDALRRLEAIEARLERLAQTVDRLTQTADSFASKLDTIVERSEMDEARRQNALIRSHAPVPAFKSSAPPPQPKAAPSDRFALLFGGGGVVPSMLR